ncbi:MULTISPECIES: ferritin-like domain-containing protein [Nocardiopsis]|uniref:Ferritin-like domain-containing protein n=1 Tax=Nocardiopsis lambiniae TaxID=3075539 RepID=A0ABU2M9Y9_9ACTN|nr:MULTISPECIES: ferritin-like domain-containing protein [unclassified Nocardiopsis]MDE3722977.1 ferritin-like domain-containing protein [Nocardiopsis sp. N85]MDT0329422.1 ferritin-like domain-containing protein [Nocardiopsis sp. DSM 44743]
MTSRERLIDWLNDAYAMERSLEKTLERHLKDAEGEPDVHARIRLHIEETRRQAETVESCVESLGGKVSSTKTVFAEMMGAVQGMVNKPAKDTLVKNALADYAAEHFEIACYKALIAAARQLGEEGIATRLSVILQEEEDMARFLEEKLPHAVREALVDADT